jgi:hypothetical protein
LGDARPHKKETDDYRCKVAIDQDNDDIYFLLYEKERNISEEGRLTCLHFRLNVKERLIHQLGTTFWLQSDEFNCLGLFRGVVRGLFTSLDKINQFDLQTRTTLPTIQLANNLPLPYINVN